MFVRDVAVRITMRLGGGRGGEGGGLLHRVGEARVASCQSSTAAGITKHHGETDADYANALVPFSSFFSESFYFLFSYGVDFLLVSLAC